MTWDVELEAKLSKKDAKKFKVKRMQDLIDVLKTDQGKNVLWELMDVGGLIPSIPVGDEAHTQRMLGKHEMSKYIYDWIMEACPKEFIAMLEHRAKAYNEFEDKRDEEESS